MQLGNDDVILCKMIYDQEALYTHREADQSIQLPIAVAQSTVEV